MRKFNMQNVFVWILPPQTENVSKKNDKADKPIKVVHCKLEYKNVVECFYNGVNCYNERVVTDRVGELFFLYNLLDESQRRDK